MLEGHLHSTAVAEDVTSLDPARSCPFVTYLLVLLGFALNFAILGILI